MMCTYTPAMSANMAANSTAPMISFASPRCLKMAFARKNTAQKRNVDRAAAMSMKNMLPDAFSIRNGTKRGRIKTVAIGTRKAAQYPIRTSSTRRSASDMANHNKGGESCHP